ncbi:hypothetical protein T492DRAFT_861956 [Pavlovales sp. CCMP2436]|nr:hypothetical protein T492DRAFT_861956 [Pavlovales sp. CCMP2436]
MALPPAGRYAAPRRAYDGPDSSRCPSGALLTGGDYVLNDLFTTPTGDFLSILFQFFYLEEPHPLLQSYGPGSASPEHVVTIRGSSKVPESKQRISERLQSGRAAGRNFQNRVALPMALTAGLVLVALLVMTFFNAEACAHEAKSDAAQCGLSAQFVPLMGTPSVAIVLLLTVLPTQTELVRIAGWVAVMLDLGVGTMMAVDLSLALYNSPDLSKGSCADIFTHEQQSCVQMSALVVGFFTWFYIGVTGSYKLARMMHTTLQARARLEQVWLLLGTDFLIGELCHFPD